MLNIEYFNVRLLLGVLRSKQVSGRYGSNIMYILEMGGVASNCLQEGGTVLPPGAVIPQVTIHFTCMYRGVTATDVFFEVLALD